MNKKKDKKKEVVTFRVTQEEFKTLVIRANKQKKSVSQVLRELI